MSWLIKVEITVSKKLLVWLFIKQKNRPSTRKIGVIHILSHQKFSQKFSSLCIKKNHLGYTRLFLLFLVKVREHFGFANIYIKKGWEGNGCIYFWIRFSYYSLFYTHTYMCIYIYIISIYLFLFLSYFAGFFL